MKKRLIISTALIIVVAPVVIYLTWVCLNISRSTYGKTLVGSYAPSTEYYKDTHFVYYADSQYSDGYLIDLGGHGTPVPLTFYPFVRKIETADPASFMGVKSADGREMELFKDKNAIYFQGIKRDDIDVQTLEALGYMDGTGFDFAKDKNHVYFIKNFDTLHILDGVDAATFKLCGKKHAPGIYDKYASDKNNFYKGINRVDIATEWNPASICNTQ